MGEKDERLTTITVQVVLHLQTSLSDHFYEARIKGLLQSGLPVETKGGKESISVAVLGRWMDKEATANGPQ